MRPDEREVYWIAGRDVGRLGIVPHPRGGALLLSDVAWLQREGVDVLVSMLTDEEAAELGLAAERDVCDARGIRFVTVPVPDMDVPQNIPRFRQAVSSLAESLADGRRVVVHCRAGVGRSSVLACAILAALGTPVTEAFSRIEAARRCRVPETEAQRRFVGDFASVYCSGD